MSNDGEYDYFFKILMIGNASVGKNSIILRFVENNLKENFVSSIGVDFVKLILN